MSERAREMAARVRAVSAEVFSWTADPRDWGRDEVDDAVAVWDALDRLIDSLTILRRDHAVVLARRVDDQYTANGVTIHREVPMTEEWNGSDVLDAMSETVIDANGEAIQAIPVEDARAVLPACLPGQTSSRWKITELRQRIPRPEQHRKRVYGDAYVARGPLAAAARRRKPSAVHQADTELSTELPGSSTSTGV
jgi:hypothetical protein